MTVNDIKKLERKYSDFMLIKNMPVYNIMTKKISLSKAETDGFDSIAQTTYIPDTQEHTLIVADNINIEPYILFHEFTHILDAEIYAKGDKTKYALSSGYTEYHASQIELFLLLGASSINDQISFSVSQSITTIAGKKTVRQYIDMKRNHAVDLFQRIDFPKDLEQLKTAIGLLFNYWGLRSICYMYCEDFDEETDNTAFTHYIPASDFNLMNKLMVGWLSEGMIDLSCKGYGAIIMPLIKKFSLA